MTLSGGLLAMLHFYLFPDICWWDMALPAVMTIQLQA
jgi:hypothetical protein